MSDKEFIQRFKKITLAQVCRELNVNYYNISGGRAGYDTTKRVVNCIEAKINALLNEKNTQQQKIKKILTK